LKVVEEKGGKCVVSLLLFVVVSERERERGERERSVYIYLYIYVCVCMYVSERFTNTATRYRRREFCDEG
jgi:hypothetical protein